MNAFLKQVFAMLAFTFRPILYADTDVPVLEDDAVPPTDVVDPEPSQDGVGEDLPYDLPDGYFSQEFGSKDVNPDQRPLRPEVMTDIDSPEELDQLILALGDDAFIPTDDLVKYGKETAENKDDDDGGDADADNTDADDEKKGDDNDGGSEGDDDNKDRITDDVAAFVEASGLSVAEFQKLPEKAQEILIAKHEGEPEEPAVDEEGAKAKETVRLMKLDPLIRARLEEINNPGSKFVASELKKITGEDLSPEFVEAMVIESDADKAAIVGEVNRLVQQRAKDAVKHERSVLESEATLAKQRGNAWLTLTKIGDIDKRLSFDGLTPESPPSDPESPVGKFLSWVSQSSMTLPQITEWGPESVYAMYAAKTGWNKERDSKIAKNAQKTLLEAMRNPETAKITSLPPGRRPPGTDTKIVGGDTSEDELVNELVSGNRETFDKLVRLHEGDPEMIEKLGELEDRAAVRRQKEGRNAPPQRESRRARKRRLRNQSQQQE